MIHIRYPPALPGAGADDPHSRRVCEYVVQAAIGFGGGARVAGDISKLLDQVIIRFDIQMGIVGEEIPAFVDVDIKIKITGQNSQVVGTLVHECVRQPSDR